MHGFLNIDKPAGMTSHDVVARVRRLAGQKRAGHAGTLDPAATGVLVVALGAATRLIEYVQDETAKGYRAVVRLGQTTTTDDAEGDPLEARPLPPLDQAALEAALVPFRGTIQQVPPMYSALHHQGQRLYDLARAGVTLDLPARSVTITQLELVAWRPPDLTLDVLCGKGTYIRSLARDLGVALGCGGHLAALRRTRVGAFTIEDAAPLDGLDVAAALLPIELAVADWPGIQLDPEQAGRVRNGLSLELPGLPGDRARAHAPGGTLLALLYRREDETWHPGKVLNIS
ncbi:MAG: tRNA pseudouridine(55) synthase TruB [Roseiflexaceae bacterium]